MSDFYDSLEEEGNEGKNSSGSLDRSSCDLSNENTPSQSDSNTEDGDSHKRFNLDICLGKKKTTLIPKSQTKRSLKKAAQSEDNFLPKIVRKRELKGAQNNTTNESLDNEFLCKQGLQLNKDGSITKSPRTDVEELPFVTREYRTTAIQNKRALEVKKRVPLTKVNRKNIFTFKENSENEISMLAIINARKKKGSSEELLTSGDSRCSSKESNAKTQKEFDNLTDSMKEMMLRKRNEGTSNNSLETLKTSTKQEQLKSESKVKLKNQKLKILPRRSDLDFKFRKTNLSYVERRQKEKGYNPLSLRLDTKKSPSETTRSNFGDAITDRLSDVSSRVPNISYEDIEEEAKFYEKIIEMDKNRGGGLSRSSRSETPVGCQKIRNVCGYRSCKDQRELKNKEKTITYKIRTEEKPTSIDFQQDNHTKTCCKKNFHICAPSSAKTVSKSELALKARAYGSMANARNIFKLKTQSENKINQNEVQKVKSSRNFSGEEVDKARNVLIAREISTQSRSFVKSSKSLNKTNSLTSQSDSQKRFVLPQLTCLEENSKSEVFKKLDSCVESSYSEFNHVSLPNLVKDILEDDSL